MGKEQNLNLNKVNKIQMENFVHAIPTELYFGKGQISHLAELLNRYGKNVLGVKLCRMNG